MYTPYTGAARILLHINGKFTMGKLRSSLLSVFQQTVGIPMGTNCVSLLADLFLYSYKAYFIQGLLKKNEKKLL
jgi:hypothetical protein